MCDARIVSDENHFGKKEKLHHSEQSDMSSVARTEEEESQSSDITSSSAISDQKKIAPLARHRFSLSENNQRNLR